MDCAKQLIHECQFIGREREKGILIEHVGEKRTGIIQITGAPGIGKSSLVKVVINSLPDKPISFFIDVREQHDVQLTKDIIRRIVLDEIKQEPTNKKLSLSALLRRLKKIYVFVFDNAEHFSRDFSTDIIQTEFIDLCKILGKARNTSVIIISTFRYCFYEHGFYEMDLQGLPEKESKSIILKSFDKISPDSLEDLVEICAGVPGVVTNQVNLFYVLSSDGSHIRGGDIPMFLPTEDDRTVRHIMSIIERLSKSIKSYLVILTYFPGRFGTDAAKHILGEKSSAEVKQRAIIPIYNRSLIEVDGQKDRFYFHRFVQNCVDTNIGHLRDNFTTCKRFCDFFTDVLRRLTSESNPNKVFPLFSREIQNIDKLLMEAANTSDATRYEKYIELACDADYLLINVLPKHSAVNFYEACVNSSKIQGTAYQQGMMLMHYGSALQNIKGNFSKAYSKFLEAEALLVKDINDKNRNGDHIEDQSRSVECGILDHNSQLDSEALARLYTCMGSNLHMQSKELDAIEKLQLASKMQDRLNLKQTRHGGLTMARLGRVYLYIKDLPKAEPCLRSSLKIRKQLFGEHPVTAETYNYFGLFYQRQNGCEEQTTDYFKMSLRTKQHYNKEPARDIVVSLNNVAMEHAKRGEHEKAFELLNDAYSMQHKLGLNHHDTSLIHNNRGKVYALMNEYDKSESSFSTALDLRKRMLGDRHTSTAGTLHQLGETLLKAKKYKEAIKRFKEALEIRSKVLKEHQPHNREIAETLICLQQAYHKAGEVKKENEIRLALDEELSRLSNLTKES